MKGALVSKTKRKATNFHWDFIEVFFYLFYDLLSPILIYFDLKYNK